MTKNSATGYKCTICTHSTHPITPLKQDTHTHRAKMLSSSLFYYTTSRIFLSVCSKSSLLSQAMFRSVGSIENLLSSKGKKGRLVLTTPTSSTFLPLTLSSPCVAGQACLSQLMGEDGEDQRRRQKKMWTSSCLKTPYLNILLYVPGILLYSLY
jgi:hypothetical protein